MTATDERRGRPSASAMARIANCPGSQKRSVGFPKKPNPYAASGDRVHAWLEHQTIGKYDGMDDDEIDIAERCMRQAGEIEDQFFGPNTAGRELYVERRLGLTALGLVRPITPDDAAIYVFTGKGDRIVIRGDSALIVDFKSGRGEYAHACENEQLRSLAVLLWLWRGISRIRVAIVQPWTGQPTVADFDSDSLAASYQWLRWSLAESAAADPETDLAAGKWCQYCPALEGCPAARSVALAPVEALAAEPLPSDPQAAIQARAMELPADQLGAALNGLAIVGWYVEAIKWAATRRIQAGEQIPGWSVHTTKPREKITDVSKVFGRLTPLGVTPEQFAAICSITKKDLKPIIRKATGTKGKGLDEVMARVIDGATEAGNPSTKLVRAGAALTDEEGPE